MHSACATCTGAPLAPACARADARRQAQVVRNPAAFPSPVIALGSAHTVNEAVLAEGGTVLQLAAGGRDTIFGLEQRWPPAPCLPALCQEHAGTPGAHSTGDRARWFTACSACCAAACTISAKSESPLCTASRGAAVPRLGCQQPASKGLWCGRMRVSCACGSAVSCSTLRRLFMDRGPLHAFAARSADEVVPGQGRVVARMQAGVKMLQLHTYLAERGYECSFAPGAARSLRARSASRPLSLLHSTCGGWSACGAILCDLVGWAGWYDQERRLLLVLTCVRAPQFRREHFVFVLAPALCQPSSYKRSYKRTSTGPPHVMRRQRSATPPSAA